MKINLYDLIKSEIKLIDNGKEVEISEFYICKTEHTKDEIVMSVKIPSDDKWHRVKCNDTDDIVFIEIILSLIHI